MNRRRFIKTGLIFVPTCFVCRGGSVALSHLDPDTYDWMQRVKANSGTYNSSSVVASDTGFKLLKAEGLRSKILRLNFICGNELAASLTPHIKDKGASYDTKTGSVVFAETQAGHGGWLAQTLGVDFIDTGLVPSTDMSGLTNDAHLAVYSGGSAGGNAEIPIGLALSDSFFITTNYNGGGLGQATDIWTATGRPALGDASGLGFYLGTRTSSSSDGVTQYKNGTLTATSGSVGGSPSNCNVSVYVTATNAGGGGPIAQALGHWIEGYSIGTGVTAVQTMALYNVFQRVETILNRPVTA